MAPQTQTQETRTPAKALDLEVIQPSALEALERASIDVQVATAHRFPRDLEKFQKRAHAMATIDAETAESCIYSRPVGKNKKGEVEYAEGASIRLAEIVAACYGNLRVASRIIEQTERFVKCEGVAHDLETNYAGKSEGFEPTVKQDGTPYSEGMRAVVAKACLSKSYRDAIFKVVPRALCKSIYEAAKKVAAGTERTIEQRRAKAKAWLNSIKVDDTRLFTALGVNNWSEILDNHLTILTGLKTAINDKDTTVEESFPVAAKKPEQSGPEDNILFSPATAATAPTDAAKTAGVPTPPAPTAPIPTEPAGGVSTPPETPKAPETPASEAGKPESKPVEPENSNETEAVQSIRLLMKKSGVTEQQVMSYCRENKMAKGEQKKLSELSDAKLITLGKAWHNVLPSIKAL